MRGGRRQRCIVPSVDARVWISGRWGPRRVRVGECVAVLTAEDSYTELLRLGPEKLRPGGRGTAHFTFAGCTHVVQWEIRRNAVWRFGRVFLACPRCGRPATRVYLPTPTLGLACRRCWGLSYASRQNSYRRSGWSAFLGPIGEWETFHARRRRRVATAQRLAERRSVRGKP
jgi:hypothetical protein